MCGMHAHKFHNLFMTQESVNDNYFYLEILGLLCVVFNPFLCGRSQ